MRLVALQRVRYPNGADGKEYKPGEQFEASEQDCKVLKAVLLAADVPTSAPQKKPVVAPIPPPELPKNDPVTTLAEDAEEQPRRRYTRRDMKAED
jgi:hypothetical protein